MSMARYSAMVVGVLAVLFGSLLATDSLLLCADRLSQNYPYRAYPPLSGMGPFFKSWGIGDAILSSFPARMFVHHSLRAGQLPLWNPLEGLGLPAAGSAGLGYMFPVHWLTYGTLHPLLAWHLELAAVMLLNAMSAFALFRRLTGCGQAAALGATAWTFGGWSAAYLQLPCYAWTFALFPFLLLGLERASQGRAFAHLHIGVAVALMVTGGHPQMLPPALGLAGCWALWRGGRRRLGLLLAMGAGVLMGAYHLIPAAELLTLSERSRNPLPVILNTLMLPREFLCMVFPTLMGQPSDNFYFGSLLSHPVINGREHCVFVGVVPLVLAMLAATRAVTPYTRPLAAGVLLGLLMAGAPWLYGAICTVFPPLLVLTPTRFLPFPLFAVCLLAAQGWASLREEPLRRKEALGLITFLGAFTAGALSFILPASTVSPRFQEWLLLMAEKNYAVKPPYFEGDFGTVFVARVLDHFSLTSPPIAISFLVVLVTCGVLGKSIDRTMPFGPIFTLVALDLWSFFTVMNTTSPAAAYFPKNPDIELLARNTTLGRAPDAPLRVLGLGDGPYPNLLLVDGISNLEAYESAHPGDYRKVIDALNGGFLMDHQTGVYVGDEKLPDGALDLLGVGILMNSPSKWDPAYGPPGYLSPGLAAQLRTAPPRAFLLDAYRIGSRDQALEAMMKPDFDLRDSLILDRAPGYSSPSSPHFQPVKPKHFSAPEVTFEVESDRPTMLVLTDLSYPGWQATVNGKSSPVLKAYGFARAVELAPGASRVTFRFVPIGFPYTPWLSALTFFLLLGYGLGQWRARKNDPA